MVVRTERAQDRAGVRAVQAAAFPTAAEADLVDALRAQAHPLVSLVAEDGTELIGHILFSPVTLPGHPALHIMGLAPLAVQPAHQRAGTGAALVRAGLEHCRRLGCGAVVVLGHPGYYPRFGFRPAVQFGIRSEYDVRDEAFMALALRPGYLQGAGGTVQYHAAFLDL